MTGDSVTRTFGSFSSSGSTTRAFPSMDERKHLPGSWIAHMMPMAMLSCTHYQEEECPLSRPSARQVEVGRFGTPVPSNRYISSIKYGNSIPNRKEGSWEPFHPLP